MHFDEIGDVLMEGLLRHREGEGSSCDINEYFKGGFCECLNDDRIFPFLTWFTPLNEFLVD